MLQDKHLLISSFQLPNTCQDQQLKIRVNNSKYSCQQIGSELVRFYRESLGRAKFVTQADQNGIDSQWNLFFTDLDELLSEP